jgi:hypothetical protein
VEIAALLRRRATHNRLVEAMPQLCRVLHDSFRYLQVMRSRVLSLICSK